MPLEARTTPLLASTNSEVKGCGGQRVFVIEDKPKSSAQKLYVLFQLSLISLPWCAESLNWQAQFNVRTPYLERYGLSKFWTSIIWLSGPIAGFVVSPVVGTLSDGTTSIFGPRRPWLLLGLILLVISNLFLATGDKIFPTDSSIIGSALLMFVLSDVAVNIVQTPLRAFNADLAPPSKQFVIQLLLVVFQGLGQMIGFLLQAISGKDDYFELFTMTCILTIAMMLPIIVYVTERPLKKYEAIEVDVFQTFRDLGNSIYKIDSKLMKLGAVNMFSWFGLFAYIPVASTWMAVSVYSGCPNPDLEGCDAKGKQHYDDGILDYATMGIWGNFVQILCAVILSIWMYSSPSSKTVKLVYALGLMVGAATCIAAKLITQSVVIGRLTVVLMNIPNTIMRAFPFAILANYPADEDEVTIGTKFGLLNVFIVLPQILVTFMVSALRSELGDTEGLPWTMFMAGVSFFFSAVSCYFIEDYEEVSAARHRFASFATALAYSPSPFIHMPHSILEETEFDEDEDERSNQF